MSTGVSSLSCGGVVEDGAPSTSLRKEDFAAAENAAVEVVNCVHPTFDSLETRCDVIDHIRRLIKRRFTSCEVFPYGSVPLRTFLPDGDIDLTVLTGPNADDSLPRDVFAILENEEKNIYARYKVRDTNFVDAEVKLVKCVVNDIIIDISFNQLGGLATLCFLDKVDRFIGNNHLLKRSIILIKTWCFYESHILGSFHGLISTYGMEVLVLYVFQLYHSSLSGPLEVLRRFLNYYSTFDWDNYGISLKGPVCIRSLPQLVVEFPEGETFHLMLGEEHLDDCIDMFSNPCDDGFEAVSAFQAKHLNIVDPLKPNNNLGRSVNRANFLRIKSAFKFGARKLEQLLRAPREEIVEETRKFFCNTLAISGHEGFSEEVSPDEEEVFSDDDRDLDSSDSDDTGNSTTFDAQEVKDEHLRGSKANASSVPSLRIGSRSRACTVVSLGSNSAEEPEALTINPLADLKGDYDGHLRNWIFCQLNYGVPSSTLAPPPHHIPHLLPPVASSSVVQSPNHHRRPAPLMQLNHDLRPTALQGDDYDHARSAHGRGLNQRYNGYVFGNNGYYRDTNSYQQRGGAPKFRGGRPHGG